MAIVKFSIWAGDDFWWSVELLALICVRGWARLVGCSAHQVTRPFNIT